MLFASPIFVFGFLPAFIGAYYLTPKKWRSALLLVASYAFYGWWRVEYLAVVIGISAFSFFAAAVAHSATTERLKRRAVRVGVCGILFVLGYFKYTHFFVGVASDIAVSTGYGGFDAIQIVLPIGISFLSFQAISYIIDVARGDAPPARTAVDYFAFSSLFPQLIAGPVLRYKDLADQFQSRTHSIELFAQGVRRFVIGLAMKLVVADTVAPLADRMFALEAPTLAEAWLGATAFSIQLFFDFAGYSAMAIGLGLMIGFRFVENFDAPYTSRSITEFWRRWHISLSNWLRDYLYIPMGGNRLGPVKTYRNLMLTMILGGFWHGANWTFVLWGAWHGLFLAVERVLGARRGKAVWPQGLGWLITMIIVVIGWVMFRATSLGDAFTMYRGMLGLNGMGISPETTYAIQTVELIALLGGVLLSTSSAWMRATLLPPPFVRLLGTCSALLLCTVALGARTQSPFLYFQF